MPKLNDSQRLSVFLTSILTGVVIAVVSAGVLASVKDAKDRTLIDASQNEKLAQIATDLTWIKLQMNGYYTKEHDDEVTRRLDNKNILQDKQIDDVAHRVTQLESRMNGIPSHGNR